MKFKSSQAGDTIIEVMIVLAILGMAISIGYATANQSLLGARQAQENSQATSILQSQIELLQNRHNDQVDLSIPDYGIYQPSNVPFCLNPADNSAIPFGADGSACRFNNEGSSLEPVTGLYKVKINNFDHTFKLEATWDDVRGEGQDTVTFTFKVYPT